MQCKTVCKVIACAGAICVGTTLGAQAQPCGTPAETGGTPLYPLPHEAEWGFVGRDGEWRLAPAWRQARPFSEGVSAVETAAGWGLIDRTGSYLAAPGAKDADSIIISGERFALSPFKPMSEGCSAATPADGTPPLHHRRRRYLDPARLRGSQGAGYRQLLGWAGLGASCQLPRGLDRHRRPDGDRAGLHRRWRFCRRPCSGRREHREPRLYRPLGRAGVPPKIHSSRGGSRYRRARAGPHRGRCRLHG